MRRGNSIVVLLGVVTFLVGDASMAEIVGVERVGTNANLNFPGFATHAPGDSGRLFVAELGGNIKIIDLNSSQILATPFLNIPDTDPAGEGGLLGLAFHPNYFAPEGTTGRGKFYVYVTVDNGGDTSLGVTSPFSSHIREYTVMGDPATSNLADASSKKEILRFVQPQSNHNAGWIGFNPQVSPGQSQFLYIASGDGGGGDDNGGGHTAGTGNAQDITNNLLGKMLRIDVDVDDFPADDRNYAIPADNPFVDDTGDDEIWAYGLRNPFRNSFDRLTGDLWIGDVGQGQREEIDYQQASKTTVSNYGWRLREGNIQTPNVGGPVPANYVPPIYDYTRGSGALQGETVVGGYRYRGPDPDLQGRYFFADANDDNVWQMTPPDPVAPNTSVINIDALLDNLSGIERIVSFAEDAKGNLYLVDMATGPNNAPNANSGEIYRILTNNLLAGDYDADGNVDGEDYNFWKTNFGATAGSGLAADGNGDNVVDAADYTVWRDNLGSSVHNLGAGSGSIAVPEPAAITLFGAAIGLLLLHSRRRGNIDEYQTNQVLDARAAPLGSRRTWNESL